MFYDFDLSETCPWLFVTGEGYIGGKLMIDYKMIKEVPIKENREGKIKQVGWLNFSVDIILNIGDKYNQSSPMPSLSDIIIYLICGFITADILAWFTFTVESSIFIISY